MAGNRQQSSTRTLQARSGCFRAPLVAAVATALAFSFGGCDAESGKSGPNEDDAGIAADLSAGQDAPEFCTDLTKSGLARLDYTFADLFAPDPRDGVEALRQAADELADIDLPDDVNAAASKVVDALNTLADNPGERESVTSLSRALSTFGDKVQPSCDFPTD